MNANYPGADDMPENPNPTNDRFAELERRTQQALTVAQAYIEGAAKAPAIEASREEAVLVRYAALASRVRALEDNHFELVGIVVELFEMVKDSNERIRELCDSWKRRSE